jgi:DNA-binding LacI/PurR family transcriptional regulator
MHEPVKRLKLYERLKSDIASGVYMHGSFLPNEFDVAKKYGYSRVTVRSVLPMLEDEKLIELLKGKGRRVCPPNIEKNKTPLTFLLPCANFISDTIQSPYSLHTHHLLQGVSQIAFEHNCRVQTVPVSSTNYQHDIDWKQLDFINSDSRVLVDGYWYCDLFSLFKERGCKVVLVENQTYHFKLYTDYLKNWFVLSMNTISAMESAVKLLADRGCCRIALAANYLEEEKDHPVLHGYKSGLAKCGLRYAAWMDTLNISNKNIGEVIGDFYRKNHFDALLLNPILVFKLRTQRSLNYCFGLPESVIIMATDEINYNQQAFPALSSLDFPYDEIGRVAARRLLEDEFRPGRQIFDARIIKRESTMHENERLALVTT